jgi:hypothetical protein
MFNDMNQIYIYFLHITKLVRDVSVLKRMCGFGREVTSKQPAVDPLLGESLLDPPQSLDLFARRYQSPSRCGSPSLEAPEYLMFGRGVTPVRPQGECHSYAMSEHCGQFK